MTLVDRLSMTELTKQPTSNTLVIIVTYLLWFNCYTHMTCGW